MCRAVTGVPAPALRRWFTGSGSCRAAWPLFGRPLAGLRGDLERPSKLCLPTCCGTWWPQVRAAAARTGRGDVSSGAYEVDESRFHELADSTLMCLHDIIDAAALDCVDDISLEDGVLTVDILDGGSFVINKHYATKQIWYASPVSGALYFSPQPDDSWLCKTRGADLVSILTDDLATACPESAHRRLDLSECRKRAP